jgi:pyruvate/2-oxoglutarate dehydrogenase complex dihydrolipoamide acyltransferase (E2) component
VCGRRGVAQPTQPPTPTEGCLEDTPEEGRGETETGACEGVRKKEETWAWEQQQRRGTLAENTHTRTRARSQDATEEEEEEEEESEEEAPSPPSKRRKKAVAAAPEAPPAEKPAAASKKRGKGKAAKEGGKEQKEEEEDLTAGVTQKMQASLKSGDMTQKETHAMMQQLLTIVGQQGRDSVPKQYYMIFFLSLVILISCLCQQAAAAAAAKAAGTSVLSAPGVVVVVVALDLNLALPAVLLGSHHHQEGSPVLSLTEACGERRKTFWWPGPKGQGMFFIRSFSILIAFFSSGAEKPEHKTRRRQLEDDAQP